MKNRILILRFRPGIYFFIIGIYSNPRRPLAESGILRIIPLHRCSGIIPALRRQAWPERFMGYMAAFAPFSVRIHALYIAEILHAPKRVIRHAKLFPLVNIRSPLHHMQTGGKHLRRHLPKFGAVVSEAGNGPWLVMVIPE